jgi:hypothetical protein
MTVLAVLVGWGWSVALSGWDGFPFDQ